MELDYSTRKYFEVLPSNTPIDYKDECSPDTPYTHAVTEVNYGLDAHFVFKNIVKNRTETNEIGASLKATIDLIIAEVTGEIGFNLTVRQEEVMNHTTLQMFGDFSPYDPNYPLPTNLTQAYEFWKRLPELSGNNNNLTPGNLTIMSAKLTPIQNIPGCQGNPTVHMITEYVLEEVNTMMDELELLLQTVGGLLNRDPAIHFKPLRENLNMYKNALKKFQLDQKHLLQQYLPNISGGTAHGEQDLWNMLDDYDQSVFEPELSKSFLTRRLRETNALEFLMANYLEESNAVVADYESANYVEYIFKKEKNIVLELSVLTPTSLTEAFLAHEWTTDSEDGFWFNNIEDNAEIGDVLRTFKAFVIENLDMEDRGYLMKLAPQLSDYDRLHTTTAYIKGIVISNQFEVPSSPPDIQAHDIGHNAFKIDIVRPSKFVTGCLVSLTAPTPTNPDSPAEWEVTVNFSLDDEDGEYIEVWIENLKPSSTVTYNVRYLTEVGRGPASNDCVVTTRITSPPQQLLMEYVSTERFIISWQPPEAIPEEYFTLDFFKYMVTIKGKCKKNPPP